MNAPKVRLGLVGCGAIAQSYAQIARDSEVFSVVGVADPRREAAEALGELIDCPAYPDHHKLAEETGCEAAVVCTPPVTHLAVCSELLARRIAVLCEKPLAIDAGSALAMFIAAANADVPLTMASKFRYARDLVSARSIVESGAIGDVVLFENSFTSRVDMTRRWNSDPAVSGGGVLIDNGTHSVDIARFMLGPIASVSAVSARQIQDMPVEDTVHLRARSATGVLASIDLSWSLTKSLEDYVLLHGTNGTLRVGWRESKYRTASSTDWVVFGNGYDKLDALRSEVENFCRALRGLEPLRITAEEALASARVIDAAYASLHGGSGAWVEVEA